MKKLNLILLAALITSASMAQTKQIAHKSHSGTTENFDPSAYRDNFGAIPEEYERQAFMRSQIQKVVLMKNDCVRVMYADNRAEDLCDHPYFSGQYTFEEIKAFYPEGTKFEGFERKFFNHAKAERNPFQRHETNWLILLLLPLLAGGWVKWRKTLG